MSESGEGRLGRRLRRILLLLPYAIKHPGVSVDELARKFDVKKKDLLEDLNLVFMCGLPGYGPGDLIDVTLDDDRVFIRMADYFAEPFRLTPAEALALYAGGSAIAEIPGMEEADALKRALQKLRIALGMGSEGPSGIDVQVDAGGATHLERLQEALAAERRVRFDYLAASHGELTEREVDPWGLVAALGHWYVVGWDHLREDERMFRVDRIKQVTILDDPAPVPDDFDAERYKTGFVGDAGQPTMTIDISPEVARWFEDYYPVTASEGLPDGWRRVTLVASGESWGATLLVRLGSGVRNVRPPAMLQAAERLAAEVAKNHA